MNPTCKKAILFLLPPILLAGICAFLYRKYHTEEPTVTPPPVVQPTEKPDAPPKVEEPTEQQIVTLPEEPLPPDVRELVSPLSSHEHWASFLEGDFVQRFVLFLDEVAHGAIPVKSLGKLRSSVRFSAVEKEDGWYLSPECAARYDGVIDLYCSIDTKKVATIWKELDGLLMERLEKLGYAGKTPRDMLVEALNTLRTTPVFLEDQPMELVDPDKGIYQWKDPKLQQLAPVQKLFLRLGARNANRLRNKTEELFEALHTEEK
ncbi:MAG: DUF3014 domain-containing protein [Victivallales bacterium]|nr:DUF3014 domain-containing protein [Victivallales bacterium]